jgi:hypothetical protein
MEVPNLKEPVVRKRLLWNGVLVLVVFTLLAIIGYLILPYGSDWNEGYRPALQLMLHGQSPYARNDVSDHPIVNPPWSLVPLLPLALLPPQWGRAFVFALAILVYSGIAIRLGAKPIGLAAFLLSYPLVYSLIYGQNDWLISIGFILPPSVGLFFVLAKPQIGIGIAIFWLVEAWRAGGWRKVLIVFGPVTLAFAVCLLIFGNWFRYAYHPLGCECNTTMWPRSLPLGLIFLVLALRQRKPEPAMASSPFLAPYVPPHSWAASLLAIVSDTLLIIIVSAATWGVWMLGGGSLGR